MIQIFQTPSKNFNKTLPQKKAKSESVVNTQMQSKRLKTLSARLNEKLESIPAEIINVVDVKEEQISKQTEVKTLTSQIDELKVMENKTKE